ncbi:MAG: WG repeat-containing protein [Acidobacteriota bacterium]
MRSKYVMVLLCVIVIITTVLADDVYLINKSTNASVKIPTTTKKAMINSNVESRTLWGYEDINTKQSSISHRYDGADYFSEGLAAVKINTKWGYINSSGNILISPRFELCNRFSNGIAIVSSTKGPYYTYGLINRSGRYLCKPRYCELVDCNNGLYAAAIMKNGNLIWGFVNSSGKVVEEVQFNNWIPQNDGSVKVSTQSGTGLLNKDGRIIINPQYQDVQVFSEGMAAVQINDKWGYIDKDGKIVIQPEFKGASQFREGLAVVNVVLHNKDKWGYIEKSGNFAIKPDYFSAGDFSEGLAPVKTKEQIGNDYNKSWGYIDKNGKMIISPQFWSAKSFSEGWAVVNSNCYIDKSGKIVMSTQYDSAGIFQEGMAEVGNGMASGSQEGFIDRNGKLVIDADHIYESDHPFQDGKVKVLMYGHDLYLDKAGHVLGDPADGNFRPISLTGLYNKGTGQWVVKPKYSFIGEFSEGLVPFKQGKQYNAPWGFLDQNGKIVIPLKFGQVRGFHNGRAVVDIDESHGTIAVIDRNGKIIKSDRAWFECGDFSEGLAFYRIKITPDNPQDDYDDQYRWGYMDLQCKTVINPSFLMARGFSEGLAAVQDSKTSKWGYIDKKGNWVFKPKYDWCGPFKNGKAKIVTGDHGGVIDKKGRYTALATVPEEYSSQNQGNSPDWVNENN